MSRSLKASAEGLRLVEIARKKKGWNKQDSVWYDTARVSKMTLRRFHKPEAIDRENFINICQAVEVDYKDVIGLPRSFWGTSPDVSFFCGRKTELDTLNHWLTKDECRVVAVKAMGGMGKSCLTKKLAIALEDKFAGVYWVSLQNARLMDRVLEDLLAFLSNQQEIELSEDLESNLLRLLERLTEKRWLVVFDNVESILESNSFCGKYRSGYENYGVLINKLCSCSHNSSIIVTSREQLPEIKRLAAETAPVRILNLQGIDKAAIGILRRKGINADESQLDRLISQYHGNPLALELAAATIKQTFKNNVELFLKTNKLVIDNIQSLLDAQFQRLSPLEISLMYWLAIYREPATIEELETDDLSRLSTRKIISALDSLRDRSLLQVKDNCYTLQNVVMEYVSELIINRAIEEIDREDLELLDTHCIIQATAPDYIRIYQYQVLVSAILDAFSKLPPKELASRLLKIIAKLRHTNSDLKYGYAPGNIINLLVGLQANLTGADFSNLTIRQAYLQEVPLIEANFSGCHFQNTLFSQAIGSILTVTFNPDQTLLATGGTDGYIRLWKVADGQEVAAWKAHNDWIRVLSFSPDGQTIASGGNDKIINLWHPQTQELKQRLSGHTDWIWSLKFTQKDNLDLLISTSSDNTARVWSLDTGKTVYVYDKLPELAGVVWSVAFSPDGETFASGSATKVQLWNINTREWIRDVPDRATRVRALCFSPDGKLLAGTNDRQEIMVWKVATGESVETLDVPSNAAIWSLQYTPDGTKLISSGTEVIQLWDTINYQPINTLKQPYHRVRSVAYSDRQNLLAVGSDDQMIKIWDTLRGQSVRTLSSHNNRLWALAIGKIKRTIVLASGSDDGCVRLWNASTGELINTFSGHQGRIRSVALSQDGRRLISASNDKTVRVWDLTKHNSVEIYRQHTDWVWKVLFLNKSQSLITISDDKSVLHFNFNTEITESFPLSLQEWMWTAAVDPQEEILALAGDNQTIDLWKIDTKEKIAILRGHQQRVKAICFNRTGNLIVSASDDNTIKVWDIRTRNCLYTIEDSQRETRSIIVIPAIAQRAELIASAGDNCAIRVSSLDGNELTTLKGHTGSIWSLDYSQDLDCLYSCSEDETIKFWDLKTGKCLNTLSVPKVYQGMNLTGVTGLSATTKESLFNLGAREIF